MKRSLVLLLLFYLSNDALAGPLGLEMGISLQELKRQSQLKLEEPYIYSTSSLPKGHPDFDYYTLLITPQHGLCKIIAVSKRINTSVYGNDLKGKFEQLEASLSAKYGSGKKFDFLHVGSIWQEPRDWMMGLLKQERTLAKYWQSEESKLPDEIKTIALVAHAFTPEVGMIELGYEFNNVDDCVDFKTSQRDSTL